ncbi:alpha/beta fold hydrolase [Aciditerrimonas ferrireducens]|uniref:Alpha/beta fold hydrolase n=1 Tax=Aciditerrimonas ferrireducens TaxID=667306 RepID=A0ABV6C2S4_9ACTN
MSESLVRVGPHELEVRVLAARPGAEALAPLVLLHEGLGSAGLWRDLPEALQAIGAGRAVVCYSRPGYGRSTPVRPPRPLRYMHQEALSVLPRLLAALGLARPVLLGHSDGASIALIHAGARPAELPEDLAPWPFWPPRGVVAIAPHVVVEDRSLAGIEAARAAYLHGDLRGRLARHHRDVDATFWGWNGAWLSPAFASWSIEEYLPRIDCPLLLVQGDQDEYGTLAQLERIEARSGGPIRRLVVAGAGHAPHQSHRELVLGAIGRFLAELAPEPAPAGARPDRAGAADGVRTGG